MFMMPINSADLEWRGISRQRNAGGAAHPEEVYRRPCKTEAGNQLCSPIYCQSTDGEPGRALPPKRLDRDEIQRKVTWGSR